MRGMRRGGLTYRDSGYYRGVISYMKNDNLLASLLAKTTMAKGQLGTCM